METFDLGIDYFNSIRGTLEELPQDAPKRQLITLTFEQLIENQDRYEARANYLLKEKLLQMQFGECRFEYFILNSQVTFSVSRDNGRSYLNLHTLPLDGNRESDLGTIARMMAEAEARILLEPN